MIGLIGDSEAHDRFPLPERSVWYPTGPDCLDMNGPMSNRSFDHKKTISSSVESIDRLLYEWGMSGCLDTGNDQLSIESLLGPFLSSYDGCGIRFMHQPCIWVVDNPGMHVVVNQYIGYHIDFLLHNPVRRSAEYPKYVLIVIYSCKRQKVYVK